MADATPAASANAPEHSANDMILFWGCFMALIATAFGFVVRAQIIDEWKVAFELTEVQKGEIFGVGLWPFSISIIIFSLIIDKIGYGKAMVFAFICHVASAFLTIFAVGYWSLYAATFIVAIGNGTVEAVINPVVATMFSREKTKWLNILHAGWPGGLVLGGILAIGLGDTNWKYKVALLLLPTIAYGILLWRRNFPVNERVASGVSYRDMLSELGGGGAFVALSLIFLELSRVALSLAHVDDEYTVNSVRIAALGLALAVSVGFGVYVRSFGRPMLVFLLLIMVPLATTELGTDSWIGSLMEYELKPLGIHSGWVLVYTSFIMMVLRFFAGPVVHKLSPLGLLCASSVVAAVGLYALSQTAGLVVFAAATLYAFGKTFFWPTMLGVVAEQYPKGGALTLNTTGGVGMLGVGVLGAAFLGYQRDTNTDVGLATYPEIRQAVVTEKVGVFGRYNAVDPERKEELSEEQKATVDRVVNVATKETLVKVIIFPVIMLVCYLILIGYFRTKGGYKAEVLTGHAADDAEFTGGVEGPVEA